jgi:hypothetical protein
MTDGAIPGSAPMCIIMTVLAKSIIFGFNKELSMHQKIIFVGSAVPVSFCGMYTVACLADNFSLWSVKFGFSISEPSYPSTVAFMVQGWNSSF